MIAALIGGIIAVASQSNMGADSLRVRSGTCTPESHIASGPADADLTKLQRPFQCSAMVTSMVDDQPGHFMFQFAGKAGDPIAFAGFIESANNYAIDRIYFTSGRPTEVENGLCRMFMKGGRLDGVFCGGFAIEKGWKTVAVVSFQAAN